jgi:hypothetical protein
MRVNSNPTVSQQDMKKHPGSNCEKKLEAENLVSNSSGKVYDAYSILFEPK